MGWVQRVERTSGIDRELTGKSAVDKAKWYGENGYWYEMVAEIEQAKKTQPNDLKLSAELQQSWQ
jgi:hypothetical protein